MLRLPGDSEMPARSWIRRRTRSNSRWESSNSVSIASMRGLFSERRLGNPGNRGGNRNLYSGSAGQAEAKRRPLAGPRLPPDPPAVARDDALHVGEPDPGTFEFGRGMHPVEGGKQRAGVLHVESGPV